MRHRPSLVYSSLKFCWYNINNEKKIRDYCVFFYYFLILIMFLITAFIISILKISSRWMYIFLYNFVVNVSVGILSRVSVYGLCVQNSRVGTYRSTIKYVACVYWFRSYFRPFVISHPPVRFLCFAILQFIRFKPLRCRVIIATSENTFRIEVH